MHESTGSKAVGSVVGEVGFPYDKESGNGALQIVVYPETTHGVVRGWVDPHRLLVGIFTGNAFVNIKEVAIAFTDCRLTQSLNGISKIQVNTAFSRSYTAAIVTSFFCRTGGNVTGSKVTKAGILAFQEIVAIFFRNVTGRLLTVCLIFRNPDTSIISKGFGHECQFGLMVSSLRDTGGVNLSVAGVGKAGTFFVSLHDGCGVTTNCIGRKVKDVAVTSRSHNHCIRSPGLDFTSDQVTSHNPFGVAIDQNQIQHLMPVVHLDFAKANLATQRRVCTKQQLLACSTSGIKGSGDLSSAKRTVVQKTAIIPSKGNALGDTLVNDIGADFRQAMNIGFP